MISLVNGYICKSFTDVAQALQGKKPPAKAGELPYSSGSEGKISAFSERQVTTADGVKESAGAQTSPQAGAQSNTISGAASVSSNAGPPSDGLAALQMSETSQAGSSQTSVGGINLLV